jgi:Brp/Blh family beta-carotene 15,15'-monooxygenase
MVRLTRIYGCRTLRAWLKFTVNYLGLASMMVGLWWIFPSFFLIIFLFISGIHFSGDPNDNVSKPFRCAYGGAAIILPALLHETAIAQLFAALVNESSATDFARYLHLLAHPWLAFVMWVIISHAKRNSCASYELIAVATLSTLLTPLLAFTIFFCLMHSARHMLRTIPIALILNKNHLKFMLALPTIATAFVLGLIWFHLPKASLDTQLLQWLFVSLAALTVPHMLLVDRLRFFGKV